LNKLKYLSNKYKYKYLLLKKQLDMNGGVNSLNDNVHPASIGSSIKHENFVSNTFHPASIKK
jgi:hypothetical protein